MTSVWQRSRRHATPTHSRQLKSILLADRIDQRIQFGKISARLISGPIQAHGVHPLVILKWATTLDSYAPARLESRLWP
eukprot:6144436-Pyramimonas_sp.AAC.1